MQNHRFFHFFAGRADAILFAALLLLALFFLAGVPAPSHETPSPAQGERFAPVHETVLPGVIASGENRGKIDINSADAALLMELDGIGETLASRIVEYREVNGPFSCPEEILNVRGIGAVRYQAIKDAICAM